MSSRVRLVGALLMAFAGLLSCRADRATTPTPIPSPDSVAVALVISPPDSLEVGQSATVGVSAVNANNHPVTTPHVNWSSSDTSVAKIASTGALSAIHPGQTRIQAQSGTLNATAEVTVMPGVLVRIQITGPSEVHPGQMAVLGILAFNSWGGSLDRPPVAWSSSDPRVATITSDGLVIGVATGATSVTAVAGSLSDTRTMLVTPQAPGTPGLAVMPRGEFGDTLQLGAGAAVQMSSFLFIDGDTNPYVMPVHAIWSSSQPDLATVSVDGLVTAVQDGTAEIRAHYGELIVSRYIRVAPSGGTVSVRFVHAGDGAPPVTLHENSGTSVTLAFGESQEEAAPAGTLQVTLDGYPLYLPLYWQGYGEAVLELQQFTGFLPAGVRATIVVVPGPSLSDLVGPVALAPLWDWGDPVPADSARVRVVLATTGGYNVYLTPPGGTMGPVFLQGCYLDWPYGVTDYAARAAGDLDIVLEPKWQTREAGRFRVTPQPGHATTYIIAGKTESTLQIWTLVDR